MDLGVLTMAVRRCQVRPVSDLAKLAVFPSDVILCVGVPDTEASSCGWRKTKVEPLCGMVLALDTVYFLWGGFRGFSKL